MKKKPKDEKTLQYTSKILKGTALIEETTILFSEWDSSQNIEENLDNIRNSNTFGKASRSRVDDTLNIIKQRYLIDSDVLTSLHFLISQGCSKSILNPILYYFTLKSDPLLFDSVIIILKEFLNIHKNDVQPSDLFPYFEKWFDEKKIQKNWSEKTRLKVAQHILATLRDFGLLKGGSKKEISSIYLPDEAFSFIALSRYNAGESGIGLLTSKTWEIFFLDTGIVERFFIECQQEQLLRYDAAGDIVRITFPSKTLTEYAHVILKR